MDIAFIHPSAPYSEGSGANHSATKIVQSLVDNGHDVTVYCLEELKEGVNGFQYNVENLELNRNLLSNFPEKINSVITSRQSELGSYDIVHSYLMRSIPAMGRLGKSTSAKPVVTLNAYGGICPRNDLLYMGEEQCSSNGLMKCTKCCIQESISTSNFEQKGLAKTLLRSGYRVQNRLRYYRKLKEGVSFLDGIAHFHSLSPSVKDHYITFGFPEKKITTIPNIIDSNFITSHKSDFSEPFELLHAGRIKHRKGCDRIIHTIDSFLNKYECDIRVTIAGDGQMLPTIRKMVNDKGLNDVVTILGHVEYDSLPTLYAEHDLFIYLGRWDEPFGRVFLESLGAGTPVFATDVGNVRDIVGDAGYISEKSEASEIADELNSILDSESLQKTSNKTEDVIKEYSKEKVYESFDAMYKNIV